MPIGEVGWPAFVQTPTGIQIVDRAELLVAFGPTTNVEVSFDPGFFHPDPVQIQAAVNAALAAPPVRVVPALVDTGATDSCIDVDLAKELNLPLIDRVKGAGVGGSHEFGLYLGYIRILDLGYVQWGRFMGVNLKGGGQQHQVLLGRTVLRGMILVYDGRSGAAQLAV